jgi:hypothetical protein
MSERKGHRICVEVAEYIKGKVETELEKHDRVSPTMAKVLRKIAQRDAHDHIKHDPSFLGGGGPAVKEKSSN